MDLMHVSIFWIQRAKASARKCAGEVHLTGSDKLPPWNQGTHLEVADLDAVSRLVIPYSERVSQRTAALAMPPTT